MTGETCQHPECDDPADHTYEDHMGNELELCNGHYFDAVWPHRRHVNVTRRITDDEPEPLFRRLFG